MSAEALKRISQGGGVKPEEVDDTLARYTDLHTKETVEARTKDNFWMVHKFYDMVTGMSSSKLDDDEVALTLPKTSTNGAGELPSTSLRARRARPLPRPSLAMSTSSR
jgi:hypothetical protein